MSTLTNARSLSGRARELLDPKPDSSGSGRIEKGLRELAGEIKRLSRAGETWRDEISTMLGILSLIPLGASGAISFLEQCLEPFKPFGVFEAQVHTLLAYKISSPDSKLEPGAKVNFLYFLAREGYKEAINLANNSALHGSMYEADPLLLAGVYVMAGNFQEAELLVRRALKEKRARLEEALSALNSWAGDWNKEHGPPRDPEAFAKFQGCVRAFLSLLGDPLVEQQTLF